MTLIMSYPHGPVVEFGRANMERFALMFQIARYRAVGVARVFAYDDTRAAVGGARFWVETPVVHDIRETLDIKVTDTLNISALIVDDRGSSGYTKYQRLMG